MQEHGDFKIWVVENVLFAELIGAWNEEASLNFQKAFMDEAACLVGKPWAHVVYLDDWVLGTPEMEPIIQDLTQWCITNGLKCAAQVFSPSMVKKFQLNKMVVEHQGTFVRKQFKDKKSAFEWLEAEGFSVEKKHVMNFR